MSDSNTALPTPPAFPPRLNFMGGGGLTLKERFKKERITDYKLDQFLHHRGKNVTERMRELDNIKLHTPTPEEVELLNVTPYRMDLLVVQEVMYLCGGLVGVRFSSSDLAMLMRLSKEMSAQWAKIGELFKHMPSKSKKLVLADTGASAISTTSTSVGVGVTTTEANTAEVSTEEAMVREFHELADAYVVHFGELQSLIAEKQKGIDPSTKTDAPKLNADPESKMGRPMPEWLTTLITKHQNSTTSAGASSSCTAPVVSPTPAAASAPALPPPQAGLSAVVAPPPVAEGGGANGSQIRSSKVKVGELSVYLSGCMTGLHSCSEAENEALAILVQASNDTVMNVSNTDIQTATAGSATATGAGGGRCGSPTLFPGGGGTPRGRKYWARRFYAFLSALSELKSALKDEGALDAL